MLIASVLSVALTAAPVLAAPALNKRQTTCSNFGAYQCVGQVLNQCSYGAGNQLFLTAIQTCATGQTCVTGAYVGCLTGPPVSSNVPKPSSTAGAHSSSKSASPPVTSSGSGSSAPSAGQACTNFGGYACDGSNDLLQCAYQSQTLSWYVLQTCSTSGLFCQTSGSSASCVQGTGPPQTSAQPQPSVKTSPTTTKAPQTTSAAPQPSGGVPLLTKARKIIYNDNTGYVDPASAAYATSIGVPGYANSDYNVFLLFVWLRNGPADSSYYWTTVDAATRQKYVNAYHAAGKLLMVSAFGATDFPTGADPVATAQSLAKFVKDYQLDGADIDWEDSPAFESGTGAGENWLISFTQELRRQLPSPRYYISHAPQAPYFCGNTAQYPKGAYLAVDKAVGNLIDWYNIQFYNQGSTDYASCDTLLNTSNGFFTNTALFQIAASGVPLSKLVIGKPVTQAGATNTGYVTPSTLASCVSQARQKGWDAGVFGFQQNEDVPFGSWIATVGAAL